MQIKEIHVENYKSFKKLIFNSDQACREVNMVFGYNNSGKSNFIRFIELVFKKKYGGNTVVFEEEVGTKKAESRLEEGVNNFWDGLIVDSPYLFTDNVTTNPITFTVKFEEKNEGLNATPDVKAILKNLNKFEINGRITYQDFDISLISLDNVLLNGKNIYNQITESKIEYFSEYSTVKDDVNSFNALLGNFNNSVLFIDSNRYFDSEVDGHTEAAHLSPKNFKRWLFDLYLNPERYEDYKQLITFLNDFKLNTKDSKGTDIEFLKNNSDYFPLKSNDINFSRFGEKLNIMLTQNKNRLPIESFGAGIQQLAYILAKIFYTKCKVLIIEEVELNQSPRYQEAMLNYLKELMDAGRINQFFFTSHSYYYGRCTHIVKRFYDVRINSAGYSEIKNVRKLVATDQYLDSI